MTKRQKKTAEEGGEQKEHKKNWRMMPHLRMMTGTPGSPDRQRFSRVPRTRMRYAGETLSFK